MIFYNCPKLFVTNQSPALTSLSTVKLNLADGCFFLTFAIQKQNVNAGKGGKAVSFFTGFFPTYYLPGKTNYSDHNVSALTTKMEGQWPSPGTYPLHIRHWWKPDWFRWQEIDEFSSFGTGLAMDSNIYNSSYPTMAIFRITG